MSRLNEEEAVVPSEIAPDPELSAKNAGLRYISDEKPGISRKRRGKGFSYHDPEGTTVGGEERKRIESLAIPPAWTNVWISPDPKGHILATGRDEAGRKQYIYHPRWREIRDQAKFHRTVAFGESLPSIREQVDSDLRIRTLSRDRVLALVVYLLDATGMRIGNDEYARRNGSFGLTTLRNRHIDVEGNRVAFHFVGKSGVMHEFSIADARAARAIRRCEELPGQELFQYIDEEGVRHRVDSGEVNDYIHHVAGDGFTAKDFRTWWGTVMAASRLAKVEREDAESAVRKAIVQAVKEVAQELGNTPAVCRAHYIHPDVIRAFSLGEMPAPLSAPESSTEQLKR